ncbi:MAG: Rieske (2Fe-2S) protein [Candidatus Limnocylindrales bacterium]
MARWLTRLVALNDGWAGPLGEFNQRWVQAVFRRLGPIKDLLHGRWLGHPLHSAATDLPIGLLLGSVILDVLGQPAAADIVLIGSILTIVLAALSGLADYADTGGTARTRATLHSTLMTVALVVLVVSAVVRAGGPSDRTIPIVMSIVGFLLVSAGAYVGGDVVYALGNMVSRHAFRGPGTKWIRLDTGQLGDLAVLPENSPVKARAGTNDIVLVRSGGSIQAMHAVCAHAGGPMDQGRLVDGCLECPWHGSRFRLSDGLVQRGPSVYDQPSYELRAADGGYEVRRRDPLRDKTAEPEPVPARERARAEGPVPRS